MIKWLTNSNSPSSILHTKTRCRSVHARGFTAGQKTMGNQDWATGPPGRWATGPPDRRAVGRGPVFSKTPTTATKVPLTESLLDNWLKNNHITVDKIYYTYITFAVCLFFFTNFGFQIYFSTAENRHKNRILWQLAKLDLGE